MRRIRQSVMRRIRQSGLWTASYGEEDSLVGSTSQRLARAILGKNFFGVEEWSSFYGVSFSNEQLREVPEFPWSEDVLNAPCPFHKGKRIKETHFAFLGLDVFKGKPLTILKWREIHPDSGPGQPKLCCLGDKCNWYANEKFANESTCGFRWYLMPLEIVPDSTNKSYQEQTEMLPTDYEMSLAIEEVTKLVLYYRKNGIYLNPTKYARCRDTCSFGNCVSIGFFSPAGLRIYCLWEGDRSPYSGLAASRKPEPLRS